MPNSPTTPEILSNENLLVCSVRPKGESWVWRESLGLLCPPQRGEQRDSLQTQLRNENLVATQTKRFSPTRFSPTRISPSMASLREGSLQSHRAPRDSLLSCSSRRRSSPLVAVPFPLYEQEKDSNQRQRGSMALQRALSKRGHRGGREEQSTRNSKANEAQLPNFYFLPVPLLREQRTENGRESKLTSRNSYS